MSIATLFAGSENCEIHFRDKLCAQSVAVHFMYLLNCIVTVDSTDVLLL